MAVRLTWLAALAIGITFVALVWLYRFEWPRFDYWDVAFFSTDVSGPVSLIGYLFRGNESMMAMPKLLIYITNLLGGENVFVLEHVLTLFLGVCSHILILRILQLPLVPGRDNGVGHWRWLTVLALFWWPAVLPTYTNTWFAIQYGLTLFFGLLSIHSYQKGKPGRVRLVVSFLAFLAAGITHGTGLVLGPALALVALVRDRRVLFPVVLIAATAAIVWVQHQISRGVIHNVVRQDSSAAELLQYLMRVITPPMWETVLFVLIVLPLLALTVVLYLRDFRHYAAKPYTILLLWGLAVWVSTVIARGGFQLHANPHYLRFFVLLYIAWAMMLFDWFGTINVPRKAASIGLALLLAVWVKGIDSGVGLASAYQRQNSAGSSALEGESADRQSLVYLYPDTERLTEVILPRLTQMEGSVYATLKEP